MLNLGHRFVDLAVQDGIDTAVCATALFLGQKAGRTVDKVAFTPVKTWDRTTLRQNTRRIHTFGSEEEVIITNPRMLPRQNPPAEFQNVTGTYQIRPAFVAEIQNGRILKQSGVAATRDNSLILDTASSRERQIPKRLSYREIASLCWKQNRGSDNNSRDRDIDSTVSLIRAPYVRASEGNFNIGGKNYSHWIQSYLTLLDGIEYYADKIGERPKLIIEPDPPSWLLQSLEFFGFGTDDIIPWQQTGNMEIGNLIVPSVRRKERLFSTMDESGVSYKLLSPAACQSLRKRAHESLGDDHNGDGRERILILRSDARNRRIINRDEVIDTLSASGFEPHVLSNLSFSEQVALFSRAEKIVGAHGAGLANMMFAKDCELIEIFGEKVKPTYYLQSQVLGLDYTGVMAESDGDDVHVPTDTLSCAIS